MPSLRVDVGEEERSRCDVDAVPGEEEVSGAKAIAGNLVLVLFIGAAKRDASPAQADELRTKIVPLMAEYGTPSTSPARIRQLLELITGEVFRIMGDDWEMDDDFRNAIDGLLR